MTTNSERSRAARALALALLLALTFNACVSAPEQNELYAVRRDGKWGYMNRAGQVVIQPQFPWAAWVFSEGLAGACLEVRNRCGYIDRTGQFVIPPQFTEVGRFSEGVALVTVGGKSGYVDRTGKVVIDPQYEEASPFIDGLAAVKVGEKFGFIDKGGKFVITPQFDVASPFFEGRAVAVAGGKAGFIDKTGKFVIDPQFDLAEPFANGLAAVKVGEKYGYIDGAGKIVIEPRFDIAAPFSEEGLALASSDGKTGFVNRSGSYEITPVFTGTALPWQYAMTVATPDIGRVSFSEGLAPAKAAGGRAGYIDKTGKFVITPQFEQAHPFYDGLALVGRLDSELGWIDKTGRYVWREASATPTIDPANTNTNAAPSATTPAAVSSNSQVGERTGYLVTNANLRSTPDKDSTSVGIHFRQAKVRILDERRFERDGTVVTWYKVRVYEYGINADGNMRAKNTPNDSDEGWINAKLVMLN